MQPGLSFATFAEEIERQAKSKRDFIGDTRNMKVYFDEDQFKINLDAEEFGLNSIAHEQIGSKLGIPKKYYDRMKAENPLLLQENINSWFQTQPKKRMVRTLDETARSFLGEGYRRLDNYDLALAILPVLWNSDVQIKSAQLTERKLYIQAVTPSLEQEVKKGEIVQAGIIISNSEVGYGCVNIKPLIFRLVCSNGMITGQTLRKYHIGRHNNNGDDISELLTDETKKLDDQAFWAKVKDVVSNSLGDETNFVKQVKKLQETTQRQITAPLEGIVEITSQKFGLSETEKDGVLKKLIQNGDLTQYGLTNAITAQAHQINDYDRSVDFERYGGKLIELPQNEWEAWNKN
ncbi:DUF932 domain-containing protein [Calditrichota bacterium]